MEISFHRDPDTGEPHIHGHGVTEAEVRQVLARPAVTVKGRGDSRLALGQTAAGRYLKIVYIPEKDWPGVFVITAYELRGKELKALRRRQRRRFK